MATERRLTRKGEARRAELLAVAARLFAERGIAATRVRDVVAAAGISNSLFYWYFADIDDLLEATVADARRRIRHLVAEAIAPIDDPLERIYVATLVTVEAGLGEEIHATVTMAEAEELMGTRHQQQVRISFEAFVNDALQILAEGQARGRVRTDEAALHLAYSWRGAVTYNLGAYQRGYLHGTPESLARSIAGFVVRGVCADQRDVDGVERRANERRMGAGLVAAGR